MADLAARLAQLKRHLPTLESALRSFQASSAVFRVVSTITLRSLLANIEPRTPASPKTLYILDSSYNPPSRAHLALASSCFTSAEKRTDSRLLLLFSTHNADKAPSPASFAQRLSMMVLFAADLQDHWGASVNAVDVDIGLTVNPFYTDKSAAVAEAEPKAYPSMPRHIHMLGYDTLTRFLAPKYYSNFTPPLAALEPFFGSGHGLLVLLRPNSSSDNAVTGDTEDEQRAYLSSLRDGNLAAHGFKTTWADQIGILEGHDTAAAEGISSTAVRKACKQHDWPLVEQMCTPGVAAWLRSQQLYGEDDRGAKMA